MQNDTPWNEFYWGAYLPHWQPKNAVMFITSRLHGSLPKEQIESLKSQIRYEAAQLSEQGIPEDQVKILLRQKQEYYFGKYDQLLDNPSSGPTWLNQKKIAKIIMESLHWGEQSGRYKLICYTIMSNHIHWIGYKFDLAIYRIMQSFKRHTAREANKLLDNTGNPFWQMENYDRWMRDRAELIQKVEYVLFNPVNAGLVENWKDWRFSWLRPEFYKLLPKDLR